MNEIAAHGETQSARSAESDRPVTPPATCPTCGQSVAVHDGRLVRHKGTQMRWSGSRWFRTTCKGSSLAPQPKESA